MREKYYTVGTVTNLETDEVYKLGDVKVIEACLPDMVKKERNDCITYIVGGNGLVAIEGEDGRLRIEKVETIESTLNIPKTTQTLVAHNIKDYMISES